MRWGDLQGVSISRLEERHGWLGSTGRSFDALEDPPNREFQDWNCLGDPEWMTRPTVPENDE
jgi:hypothetical protein